MRIFLVSVTLMLSFSVAAVAQSGRRTNATPTPTPQNIDDPSQYSESKPRNGNSRTATDRFPGISLKRPETAPSVKPQSTVSNPSTSDDDVVRIETNLVTIPVSVFDRNGLYIPGLRQTDFRIFEDGVEQQIEYFGTQDKPFTVALVLDTSPSTQYQIDEIHRAAQAFVNQLGPNDSVIVIEFHHKVKVQTEVTKDRDRIYKAINRAKFGDGTSLYNAVDEALRKQLGKIEGRKAVVLFTDGVDTTSNKNSYDSTLNFAEESDSLVFPIYYNTFFETRQSAANDTIFGVPPLGTTAEEYALGRKYLEELADVTGGRVFRPEATPGGLTRAFEGIAEELRRQYNVGYVPSEEGRVGQRKQIRVRVNRPNLIIRARDSYIVGSTQKQKAPQK